MSSAFFAAAVPSSPTVASSSDLTSPAGHRPVRELAGGSQGDATVQQYHSSEAMRAVVQVFIDPRYSSFSTDNTGPTRYVKVEFLGPLGLRRRCSMDVVEKTIKGTPWQEACKLGCGFWATEDYVVFEFDSFTDAQAAIDAKDQLVGIGPIVASFISIEEFAEILGSFQSTRTFFSKYEGQIIVNVIAPSHSSATLEDACMAIMSWMDEHLGSRDLLSVMLHQVVREFDSHTFRFRLELNSRRRADMEVDGQAKNGRIKDSMFGVSVCNYLPDGYQPLRRASSPIRQGGPVQPLNRRYPSSSARRDDQSNAIDIDKIKRGQDVRTTVMLRNIPNQMNTYDLEELLKGWAFGKFDFLYLRIDFANMCNVGYAFVNFDTPITIVKVKQQLDAEGWPGHLGSNKRAAMSYATVQGVESLIEKFRNSSVMLEAPSCRPRLFWTLHDVCSDPLQWHLQSQEKPFPTPNNEAKLARSRQNAETQGLYPAHSRDEHRRGSYQSNFDRGNPNSFFNQIAY